MDSFDIYLARHGETAWSREGRHTGRTDLPLLPEGTERAAALAPRLTGIRFAAVYSSPLRRARETAAAAGYPEPIIEPALAEWDYGEYEGITTSEIHRDRPGWDLWTDGAPGGETPDAVVLRAGGFLHRLLAEPPHGPVLLFSHGHLLRVMAVAFLHLPIAAGAVLPLDTATVSILRTNERGPQLQLWNGAEHLPGEPR